MAVAALVDRGRAAFNRGQFFEAHELWEDAWRELTGPDRSGMQGLIQIAAGLHHLQGGRPRPGSRLLRKGLAKLPVALPGLPGLPPPTLLGLPIQSLAGQVARLLDEIEAAAEAGPLPDLGTLSL